jgi:predicted XRE-type DNA-binding protein
MRRRSKSMTADLALQIKRLWHTTELAQHEIAAQLDINQGRVSEVLTGKRFWWISFDPKGV